MEGREIISTKIFKNTGGDFSGYYQAQTWLKENGYSYGSMQRDSDIGIMKGDVIISKWRGLSFEDIANLDGVIDCQLGKGYRYGDVRVVLYKKNSTQNIEYAKSQDIKYGNVDISEYVISTQYGNDFNKHILVKLEKEGKLGNYINQGNDRIVFENIENPNFVIKVPKHDEGIRKNEEEYSQYMTQRNFDREIGHLPKNPIATCIMIGDYLLMEKLNVQEGTDFGIDKDGKLKRFDLF